MCAFMCVCVLAIISLYKLKVPVITSQNYDGDSFVFTFHFRHLSYSHPCCEYVCFAPPFSAFWIACYVHFVCVCAAAFFPVVLFIFHLPLKNWKTRNLLYLHICAIAKHRFNCFFSSVFASNLLDMFIGTACHKKISGVNFFFIRFDVNVRNGRK